MLNHQAIGSRRLITQRITGEKFERPEDLVRWMGALQAQDYGQAVWAIGLRLRTGTLGAVEQALEDGRIIRTWPMRGTLHFVPPEDARWMVSLGAARMLAADARRQAQLELTPPILARCEDLFIQALSGGKRLSRPEMMSVLEAAGISTAHQRGYHILWYVAQRGVIYLGPMYGKQQTFGLLDELVPHARTLARDDALAELARRYFVSHGPATAHDFAWWAGIPVTEARRGLEAAKPALIAETFDGKEYWLTDGISAAQAPGVYLLPGFDEYLLGYKDRSAVLLAEFGPKIVPGNNGVFLPLVVVGDQVVGTWKRSLKKKTVDVQINPFRPLDAVEDQVIEAARAYADFVGLPLTYAIH